MPSHNFKVTNENTRTLCEIYSKLTIKFSGVFIVNFGVFKVFFPKYLCIYIFCTRSCIRNFFNVLFKANFLFCFIGIFFKSCCFYYILIEQLKLIKGKNSHRIATAICTTYLLLAGIFLTLRIN